MSIENVARENGSTSEATPDSGTHVVSSVPPKQIAKELARWFRELRAQMDLLALCVDDAMKENPPMGIDDTQRDAMVEAIRCQLEFDYWVHKVGALESTDDPRGAQFAHLEENLVRKKIALVDLIDNPACCALVSLKGERGRQLAEALDELNNAQDALVDAKKGGLS